MTAVSAALPLHYLTPQEWMLTLAELEQPALAAYLSTQFPNGIILKSGDLGEILGTAYIEECTDFSLTVRKLRYSPSRRAAMNGDDLLSFRIDNAGRVHVLKGESKSRANLRTDVITGARKKLDEYGGCPDAATVTFCHRMLQQEGHPDAADAILKAQMHGQITPDRVTHMIFTVTGNDPTTFLQADLAGPLAVAARTHVGLHIPGHQTFINTVFAQALTHGDA